MKTKELKPGDKVTFKVFGTKITGIVKSENDYSITFIADNDKSERSLSKTYLIEDNSTTQNKQ